MSERQLMTAGFEALICALEELGDGIDTGGAGTGCLLRERQRAVPVPRAATAPEPDEHAAAATEGRDDGEANRSLFEHGPPRIGTAAA